MPNIVKKYLLSVSLEITWKIIIILKYHSGLVNYVKILIFFFFLAITNLKNFRWCNVIQQIKKTLALYYRYHFQKIKENGVTVII